MGVSGISNLFVVSNFLVDGVISWELIGTPWDELDGGCDIDANALSSAN